MDYRIGFSALKNPHKFFNLKKLNKFQVNKNILIEFLVVRWREEIVKGVEELKSSCNVDIEHNIKIKKKM